MNEPTTDDNTTCIFCKDNNAVCANVGTKATCWCRAGYDKIGDECRMYYLFNFILFSYSTY